MSGTLRDTNGSWWQGSNYCEWQVLRSVFATEAVLCQERYLTLKVYRYDVIKKIKYSLDNPLRFSVHSLSHMLLVMSKAVVDIYQLHSLCVLYSKTCCLNFI